MSQAQAERDELAAFLAVVDRQRAEDQIRGFIQAARERPAVSADLIRIGSRLDDVAAYAGGKGFDFTASELDAFFERRIRRHLPDEALRLRDSYLERRRRGELPGPLSLDEPCAARLLTHEHRAGFRLDRAAVLSGDVFVLRGVPALTALIDLLRAHLERTFRPHDPLRAHEHFDGPEMKRRVEALYAGILEDEGIPPLMAAFVAELGMPADEVVYEWPGLRLMRPQRLGGRGYYRSGDTGAVGPHRDTWYGSPQHQINFWAPLHPLAKGAGLHVFPDYYRRSVRNSSLGYDVWRNKVGLQLNAVPLQPIDGSAPIRPHLEVGELICFAAHHLHGGGVNRAETLRISLEFRLLNRADVGAEYVPPNLDYHGFGVVYDGWYRCDGSAVI